MLVSPPLLLKQHELQQQLMHPTMHLRTPPTTTIATKIPAFSAWASAPLNRRFPPPKGAQHAENDLRGGTASGTIVSDTIGVVGEEIDPAETLTRVDVRLKGEVREGGVSTTAQVSASTSSPFNSTNTIVAAGTLDDVSQRFSGFESSTNLRQPSRLDQPPPSPYTIYSSFFPQTPPNPSVSSFLASPPASNASSSTASIISSPSLPPAASPNTLTLDDFQFFLQEPILSGIGGGGQPRRDSVSYDGNRNATQPASTAPVTQYDLQTIFRLLQTAFPEQHTILNNMMHMADNNMQNNSTSSASERAFAGEFNTSLSPYAPFDVYGGNTNATGSYSSDDFCSMQHLYLSDTERNVLLGIGSLLTVLTVVLNCIIIMAFITFKQLRTAPNLYIINLTICDLLLGLVNFPMQLTLDYRGCWPYSSVLCHATMIIGWIIGQEVAVTMVLIAYDRYLMVKLGPSYSTKVTNGVVARNLLISWALNSILYIPCHVVHLYTGTSLAQEGECTPEFYQVPVLREVIFVVATFLSPVLLAVLYFCVYLGLRMRKETAGQRDRHLRRTRRAATSMAILTGVFLLTWMPMGLVGIGQMAVTDDPTAWRIIRKISLFFNYLLLSNAVINPFLYAFTFPQIRQAMLAVVLPKWCAWHPQHRSSYGDAQTSFQSHHGRRNNNETMSTIVRRGSQNGGEDSQNNSLRERYIIKMPMQTSSAATKDKNGFVDDEARLNAGRTLGGGGGSSTELKSASSYSINPDGPSELLFAPSPSALSPKSSTSSTTKTGNKKQLKKQPKIEQHKKRWPKRPTKMRQDTAETNLDSGSLNKRLLAAVNVAAAGSNKVVIEMQKLSSSGGESRTPSPSPTAHRQRPSLAGERFLVPSSMTDSFNTSPSLSPQNASVIQNPRNYAGDRKLGTGNSDEGTKLLTDANHHQTTDGLLQRLSTGSDNSRQPADSGHFSHVSGSNNGPVIENGELGATVVESSAVISAQRRRSNKNHSNVVADVAVNTNSVTKSIDSSSTSSQHGSPHGSIGKRSDKADKNEVVMAANLKHNNNNNSDSVKIGRKRQLIQKISAVSSGALANGGEASL